MRPFYLNPAVLSPMVWATVVAGALLSGMDFYPLSGLLYVYLASAVGIFSVSAVVGTTAARLRISEHAYRALREAGIAARPNQLVALHVAVMAVSLVFQCLDHRIIAGANWWRPEGLIVYRLAVSEFGLAANYRFTAALNYFFFAAPPILWLYWRQLGAGIRWAAVILLTAFVYLSTARSSFFTIALLLGFFVQHFRPRVRLVLIAALILFFAFQLLGSIVGKGDFDAFWIYLFAPVFALDQILHGVRTDLPGTYYSFRFFQPYLAAFGFVPGNQSNLLSYYSTPYQTNVYTVFGPFVLDFGITWSLVITSVFGFVSGLLYGIRRKHPRVPYLAFLCSLSLTVLVLGVFYDYYTSSGYVWFSLFFATLLFPRVDARANVSLALRARTAHMTAPSTPV